MRFTVDFAKCESHGQCTYAARALFSLADDGGLAFDHEPDDDAVSRPLTDSEVADAGQAVDRCPMQAISLVE